MPQQLYPSSPQPPSSAGAAQGHNGQLHPQAVTAAMIENHVHEGQPVGQSAHQGQPVGRGSEQTQATQRTFVPVGGPPAGVPMRQDTPQPTAKKQGFIEAHKRDLLIGAGAAFLGAMLFGGGKGTTLIQDVASSASRNKRG